uniref:NADH-ubiquinone oxidoreductase chain 3 n=1 Tax=Neoephemera projecta TaxID=2770074 RepID=A0A8K1R9R4_9INSE|nr:NADH dehydrogenase subunit 3 [Neoephemera projecta]
MLMVLFYSFILITITLIIMMMASILSKKMIIDREKSTPFECGFDPSSSSRLPFSLRFFLIAVVFLIFDVEIALLLPLIILNSKTLMLTWFYMTSFFLLVLLIGLYHEWNQGALNWVN